MPPRLLLTTLMGVLLGLTVAGWQQGALADPSALAPSSPAAAQRDARVRAEVRRILTSPDYREFSPSRQEALSRWLAERLRRLDAWIAHAEGTGAPASGQALPAPPVGLLVAVSALLTLLTVWWWVRSRAPASRSDGPVVKPASPQSTQAATPEALAARGEYRLALRALFLATLVFLDRSRVIEFEEAATNGQYLSQLPAGELRSLFEAFTRLFDRTWYGRQSTGEADYATARQLVAQLNDAVLARTGEPS